MRALLQPEYGTADVLKMGEVEAPKPGRGEIRVSVRAGSLTIGDHFMLLGTPYLGRLVWGLFRPSATIPGLAIAGVVESVGEGATDFLPGDEVFGEVYGGGFAELVCADQSLFARKPAALSWAQTAALPVAAPTALQGLRDKGQVKPGDRVLINGGSGGVGTYAVQIAKALGADVTAVCSTHNVEQARRLGADHVVDYTREDFVAQGISYDVIFDLAGSRSLSEIRSVLKPEGTYVCSTGTGNAWVGPMVKMLGVMLLNPFTKQNLVTLAQEVSRKSLEDVLPFVEAGQVTPAIERTFAFDEVIDAYRAYGRGHAKGKTVFTV